MMLNLLAKYRQMCIIKSMFCVYAFMVYVL